jgi:hypothetical protein
MVNNLINFKSNYLIPELTGGLLMKEAIAPSRQRPKIGVFDITSSVYLLY